MPYTPDAYDNTKPAGSVNLASSAPEEFRAIKTVLIDHRDRIVDLEAAIVAPASETVRGLVEFATPVEAVAGADATRAMSPATVEAARIAVIHPVASFSAVFSAGGVTEVADLAGNVTISDYARNIYANTLTWKLTFTGLGFDLVDSPRNFTLVGGSHLTGAVRVTTVNSTTAMTVAIQYIPNEWDFADFHVSCVLYAAPISP